MAVDINAVNVNSDATDIADFVSLVQEKGPLLPLHTGEEGQGGFIRARTDDDDDDDDDADLPPRFRVVPEKAATLGGRKTSTQKPIIAALKQALLRRYHVFMVAIIRVSLRFSRLRSLIPSPVK